MIRQKTVTEKTIDIEEPKGCPGRPNCDADCPFEKDPSEIPKAHHIYGDPEDNGNHSLEKYDSPKYRMIRYLKENGNEFGEPISDLSRILNVGYRTLHQIAEENIEFEVIPLSRGDRVRLVRSKVGW